MIAANGFAQGVIDVHSHLITPEFVSSLENEGRLMDEGFPLGDIGIDIGGTTTFVSGDGEKNQ